MTFKARRFDQVIGLPAAVTMLSAANAGGGPPVTDAANGQASVLRHPKPGRAAMAVDDGLAKPPFTRRHSPVQARD